MPQPVFFPHGVALVAPGVMAVFVNVHSAVSNSGFLSWSFPVRASEKISHLPSKPRIQMNLTYSTTLSLTNQSCSARLRGVRQLLWQTTPIADGFL